MNNYKIRVNNEAESREAQELFFELGYRWNYNGKTYFEVSSREILAYSTGVLFQCGKSTGEELTLPQLRDLVAQSKSNEQSLISGADALRALADGEEVEALVEFELGLKKWHDARDLPICDVLINGFDFRLKPRTIKLEIEIPAPFDPKVGEEYYYPYSHSERGYALDVFKGGRITNQFGAWRKEADIKIVVEQLRKLKEHSK